MTKAELIETLQRLSKESDNDRESAHIEADNALLEFINDQEITDAYNSFDKWHA